MLPFPTINWRTFPVLRLLLAFGLGVVLVEQGIVPLGLPFAKATTGVCLLGLALVSWRPLARRWTLPVGALLLLFVTVLGYTRTLQHDQSRQATHFSQRAAFVPDSAYVWTARVISLRAGTERWRLVIAVDGFAERVGEGQASTGHLQVYLPASAQTQQLLPGNRIAFRGAVRRIGPLLNPGAFDAARYFARQNVFHRCWVSAGQWQLLDTELTLYGRAYQAREHLLGTLRRYLPAHSNELAVAAALTLGKRDELTTDLRNAYAETGAVHVLAVSGLHLAFVTIGLGWLLAWLPRKNAWGRWLYFGLVIVGTWAFAFVTGLAPSVLRAAVMLTALELGRAIGRRSSTYNTLALSAFLLLFYDPYLLFNVGFQLSYLAVLGIVFFQDRIYRLLYVKHPVLEKMWSLTSVALAAQLTTLPLGLYYFHQFPVYFLLTGIFVVLLAQVVLGAGIVLFVTATLIPLVAQWVGELLYWSIFVMNSIIHQVRALPGHLLAGIWINEWILALLCASVLALAIFMTEWRKPWLWLTMALLLITTSTYVGLQIVRQQQRQLIVYHQYKGSVMDAFTDRARLTISNLPAGDERLQWSVEPYRQQYRTVAVETHPAWLDLALVYGFYQYRLAVIDEEFKRATPPATPLSVDWVVLRDSPRYSLAELQSFFDTKYWIIDGSNYPSRAQAWLEEAAAFDQHIHYTARDGAFIHQF
ncbi:MAG: ComEC/Rec2 family competence protein [Bacteroidota bacterium]